MILDFTEHVKSSVDSTQQPYRGCLIGEKNAPSPIPLIVCLHGKGVDHNAWFDATAVKKEAEAWGPCLVVSPLARGTGWYRGVAEQDVLDVIAHVQQKPEWQIDPRRVYLAGHSMGGFGTQWISNRHPGLFAATAPMAGFSVDELSQRFGFTGAGTNALLIHDTDDDIVAVEESRRSAAWLSLNGQSHRYIETSGYGHSSQLISDFLPTIFEWFDAHQLKTEPVPVPQNQPLFRASEAEWPEWNGLLRGKNQRETAEAVTTALRLSLAVDAVLVHEQDFSLQPFPLSKTLLESLYAHPHAGIDFYEMSLDFFQKLLAQITFSTPIYSLNQAQPAGQIRVAIAQSISRRFALELESAAKHYDSASAFSDVLMGCNLHGS